MRNCGVSGAIGGNERLRNHAGGSCGFNYFETKNLNFRSKNENVNDASKYKFSDKISVEVGKDEKIDAKFRIIITSIFSQIDSQKIYSYKSYTRVYMIVNKHWVNFFLQSEKKPVFLLCKGLVCWYTVFQTGHYWDGHHLKEPPLNYGK